MQTVLVTGFEPFDGGTDNPAMRLARALADDPPPGVRLHAEILPVSYAAAGSALHAALLRHRPDVLRQLPLQ